MKSDKQPNCDHLAQLLETLVDLTPSDLAMQERVKANLLAEYDHVLQQSEYPLLLTRFEAFFFQRPWRVLLPISCAASLSLALLVDHLFIKVFLFLMRMEV